MWELECGLSWPARSRLMFEGTSQFTREYKRLLGQPPTRDVKARRLANSSTM
jgi:hypothetical protein